MQYALITVPATWDSKDSIGFTKQAYEQVHEEIQAGCRVLVYMAAPVNAIVAEAIIPDNVFQRLADWPDQNKQPVQTANGESAEYVLPLRVLASYTAADYVPEERIYEVCDMRNVASRQWIPIDDDTYRALREFPN